MHSLRAPSTFPPPMPFLSPSDSQREAIIQYRTEVGCIAMTAERVLETRRGEERVREWARAASQRTSEAGKRRQESRCN